MAFADDIVLITGNPLEMQGLLDYTLNFMGRRGMTVNPTKCHSIYIERAEDRTYTVKKPLLRIRDGFIIPIRDFNSFKYLGHLVASIGTLTPSMAILPIWLKRLQRAPLKPQQKLSLLTHHVLPKLYHCLQNPKVTTQLLKAADRVVKMFVKNTLHLYTHQTPRYTPKQETVVS